MIDHDIDVMPLKEYAIYLEKTRELVFDKITELEGEGKISKEITKEIFSDATAWFVEKYPHLLPTT